MFCRVFTTHFLGIEGGIVNVEVDVSSGLPSFRIVGEIGAAFREADARILTALRNSGYGLPPKRYIVNLVPAGIKKTGTSYDLPIAIALLSCVDQIRPEYLKDSIFIGELGLDGKVIPVQGILTMVSHASKKGFKHCFIPALNLREAMFFKDMHIYAVHTLKEVIEHLNGICPMKEAGVLEEDMGASVEDILDFKDIQGQQVVKRCIEICVAGHHHLLMIGPPGSGKTMMAERIPYIMPEMTFDEQMLITKIFSAGGRLRPGDGLIKKRPFRRPHHSVSDKVLIGGGIYPMPGEISLSHGGVLFLDEFAEFSRNTVEALRQPMEMGEVFLNRVKGHVIYPAKPLIVAATNPCRCGYYPDRQRCQCTEQQVRQYMSKISGPILERMDLCIHVERVRLNHMHGERDSMDSHQMRTEILRVQDVQKQRFVHDGITYNSEMNEGQIRRYCQMEDLGKAFLDQAFEHYHMSVRMYQKLLKVGRTIADLEGSDLILKEHLMEALCYRTPDEMHGGVVGC